MRAPSDLEAVRASYDRVADSYVALGMGDLAPQPWLRAALAAFAERVRGLGPVLDVGCGPGQVTAHLADLGLDVSGVDLSPRMVEHARRLHPACASTSPPRSRSPSPRRRWAGSSAGGRCSTSRVTCCPPYWRRSPAPWCRAATSSSAPTSAMARSCARRPTAEFPSRGRPISGSRNSWPCSSPTPASAGGRAAPSPGASRLPPTGAALLAHRGVKQVSGWVTDESVCTPGPVPGPPRGIGPGGDHPSRPAVAGRFQRSTRRHRTGRPPARVLRRNAPAVDPFDLAPGGVCRAAPVTRGAGALLPHRFTLAPAAGGPVAGAVYFLWHFPAGHPGSVLPTTLPCGARTFLGDIPTSAAGMPTRPPDRLVRRRPG